MTISQLFIRVPAMKTAGISIDPKRVHSTLVHEQNSNYVFERFVCSVHYSHAFVLNYIYIYIYT